jgi:hypothetical protein
MAYWQRPQIRARQCEEFVKPAQATMTSEKARGRLVPIWFAEDHHSSFSSPRVQFVSAFKTPPSSSFALGFTTFNLEMFAVGLAITWAGIRTGGGREDDP